jgi:hypothetical protein
MNADKYIASRGRGSAKKKNQILFCLLICAHPRSSVAHFLSSLRLGVSAVNNFGSNDWSPDDSPSI